MQIDTSKLLRYHVDRKNYELQEDGGAVSVRAVTKASEDVRLRNARLLLQAAVAERQAYGFSNEEVRILCCCAYQAMQQVGELPQVRSEEVKGAFCALMGLPQQELPELFEKLVLANHLHYKINRLGLNMDGVSLLVDGQWIALDQVRAVEENEGRGFYAGERLLFKTDLEYRLKGYFFCGVQGIVPGSELAGSLAGLEGTHPQEKGDGNYYALVGTNVTSTLAPVVKGDHSYVGWIDAEGNKTVLGQFGNMFELGIHHLPTMCAHKESGIECPDRYYGIPYTQYHTLETKHPISPKEFEMLKERAKEFIQKGRPGSMMEDNCTGFVAAFYEGTQVNVQTAMTPTSWFYRWLCPKILPYHVGENFIRFCNQMPKVFRALFHYLNPIYPIQIFYGLIQSITSFEWEKGWKNILNIHYVLRAIFCPWHFYVNHPLALREWQLQRHHEPRPKGRGLIWEGFRTPPKFRSEIPPPKGGGFMEMG